LSPLGRGALNLVRASSPPLAAAACVSEFVALAAGAAAFI